MLKIIGAVANLPVYLASRLLPKRSDLWVFGAWYGTRYSDSPRALYEYMLASSNVECWWLTSSKDVYEALKASGRPVVMAKSWKGFWISARAGVGVICTGLDDLNRFALPKLVVNCWHGIPLKRIMWLSGSFDETSWLRRQIGRFLPYTRYDLPYPVIVSSDWERPVMEAAFRIGAADLLETGLPRNDHLSTRPVEDVCRRVIWMPTHRKEGQRGLDDLIADLPALDPLLQELGIELYVKLHHYHGSATQFDGCSAILAVDDSDPLFDLYRYLDETAVLITDYSSVAFDFLLTGRPVVYAPFDLEDYVRSEGRGGFLMDYSEFAAGPICRTWAEVGEALRDIFEGRDRSRDARSALAVHVHQYRGESASAVLAEAIAARCGLDRA